MYEGKIFTVREETFRHEDGEEVDARDRPPPRRGRRRLPRRRRRSGSCASRARRSARPDLLEIPAGKLDDEGEEPLETAKRELAEEIGKEAARLGAPRARSTPRRASPTRSCHLFLATGLSDVEQRRGRRARAHRHRGPAARRARRDPRRDAGLEDADRAARAARADCAERRRCTGRPSRGRRRTPSPWPSQHRVQPFEHLVLDFLAYLEFERGLSRNTLEAYRSDLLQFGDWLQRTAPTRCTLDHADARRVRLRARRRARGDKPGAARDAAAQGRLPALLLPPPAPPGPDRGRPDRQAAARRARAASSRRCSRATRSRSCSPSRSGTEPAALRDRALLELMYACGLRASEAIDLEVGDVDLEAGVLRARGKGSKERLVPVGSRRRARARRLPRPRPPEARRRPLEARLFVNHRGAGLTRQGLYKIVQRHAAHRGARRAR